MLLPSLVVIDRNGRIVSWSQSAERTYGYTTAEAIGQSLGQLICSPASRAQCLRFLQRAAGGSSLEREEALHHHRLGQPLTVAVSSLPMRDSHNDVRWILLVIEPRAEPSRASNEGGGMMSDAERAKMPEGGVDVSSDLTDMAAVIAHELRNPLAGVRAATEMLWRRLREAPDGHMVHEVIDRIDALDALLDDLLLFAETPQPQFSEVSLGPLLEDVIDSLRGRFTADFRVQAPTALPPVRGDERLLRVVFQNLLVNAAQATVDAGTVDVSVFVELPVVAVSIADEGPGFSVEARHSLFRPFFTTKSRGTGLGLPVARRLIALHGGRLEVDGGQASGARVLVTLPIAA